jgi:hypothetical protein
VKLRPQSSIALLLISGCLFGGFISKASAGIIYGTGAGVGPGGRDTNWSVVAVPTGWTPPSGQTTPYSAYVYNAVAYNWVGSGGWGAPTQVGYTNADGTFYWEGIQPSADAIYGFPTDYNYILAQTFTVDQAGYYNFLFPASGDNTFSFYINGTVVQDTMKPTISGGTQIGTSQNNFWNIYTVSGGAMLHQGVNTAYALINEQGFSSGVLIGQSSFSFAGVPEPSTYALMGLGGLALVIAYRRRVA